jgi:ribonuclease HI
MVYYMEVFIDGGCHQNGQPGAMGVAAAIFKGINGKTTASHVHHLPRHPPPTSQRAEITAIILGLERALAKSRTLATNPELDVKIYSDSRYAISCLTIWIHKWRQNGWINAKGREVANRDLIERASHLGDLVEEKGVVHYIWISREHNEEADELCTEELNERRENGDY